MAVKKFRSKVTGVHAMTGIYLVEGETYEIEEALAGKEIFEPIETIGQKSSSLRKRESRGKELDSASSAE